MIKNEFTKTLAPMIFIIFLLSKLFSTFYVLVLMCGFLEEYDDFFDKRGRIRYSNSTI